MTPIQLVEEEARQNRELIAQLLREGSALRAENDQLRARIGVMRKACAMNGACFAAGTIEQHEFAAVGGEFPDTCIKCACFRDSVVHFPEIKP